MRDYKLVSEKSEAELLADLMKGSGNNRRTSGGLASRDTGPQQEERGFMEGFLEFMGMNSSEPERVAEAVVNRPPSMTNFVEPEGEPLDPWSSLLPITDFLVRDYTEEAIPTLPSSRTTQGLPTSMTGTDFTAGAKPVQSSSDAGGVKEVSVTEPTRNIYALEGPEAAMSAAATSLRELGETLEEGSSGQQVRNVQYRLSELGYDIGRGGRSRLQKDDTGNWRYLDNSEMRGVDGSYGTSVAAAVREFQEDAGIEPTGIVDAATASAMANAEPVRFRGLDTSNMSETQIENYNTLLEAAQNAGMQGAELASFMAQAGHESMEFATLTEMASGQAYEGREDLGNTQPGDGRRYKGRGHIQLTGRANYRRAGEALGLDLENNPELVEDPSVAARVSLWFWETNVRPQVPDFNDIERVTKVVNGGFNGLDHRKNLYDQFAARFNENLEQSAVTESLVPRPRPNTQE